MLPRGLPDTVPVVKQAPRVFSTSALRAESHIGINFNRIVLLNPHPSILDPAPWRRRSPGPSFQIVTVTPVNGNKVQASNKRPQVLDRGIGSDGAHHSEQACSAPTVDSVVIILREVVHFLPLVPAKCPTEL